MTLSEFYVYDGNILLLVLDGSGNVKNRYLNGPNENQVLAEETNISGNGAGTTHCALTDHEGSIRDVVGNSGTVLDHIQYDSFGNVLSQTDSAYAMRMGYTGQVQDAETGLCYDHARYYDPASGRFLSTDPSAFSAGDENLYRYVGNSPLDNTDPSRPVRGRHQGFGGPERCDDRGPPRSNRCTGQVRPGHVQRHGYRRRPAGAPRRGGLRGHVAAAGRRGDCPAGLRGQRQGEPAERGRAVRQRGPDSLEKLQGSGAILANTFTFGGSDAAGWTQSTRYQGDGFDAARLSAGISRDAALVLVTGGFSGTAIAEESTVVESDSLIGSLEDWQSTASAAERITARDVAFEAENAAAQAPQRFSDAKQALVDMAKADKRSGITEADMQAYKDLNRELPDPFHEDMVRGPEAHSKRASPISQQPHGHVGPVGHIPIR